MQQFEYRVVPSPARGEKVPGAKTGAERFSAALTRVLNDMAAQGWDYVRAETLPSEERSGIASRRTEWMNVLVFRRALAAAQVTAPAPAQPAAAPLPQAQPAPVADPAPAPQPAAATVRPMPPLATEPAPNPVFSGSMPPPVPPREG